MMSPNPQRTPHPSSLPNATHGAAPKTSSLILMLIIGGDIVQCAITQLAGTGPWYFTTVAFSSGTRVRHR
ncbi:hypothetical protein C8Q74DRAFT_1242775 [Fomes fomentarius]|nr:hypothetical protein C8Q74DRAFT_1242775 [Fomes fomentarius]